MQTSPDRRVRQLLRQVLRRLRLQGAAHAVAFGGALAVVPYVVTRNWSFAAGMAGLGAIGYWWASRGPRTHIAAQIEARAPQCRNVLVTAEALLDGRLKARPEVVAVVLDDAAIQAATIAPAVLWPWRRAVTALAGAVVLWSFVALIPAGGLAVLTSGAVEASSLPVVDHVAVVVTPPAYSMREPETLDDPERVSVLAGSRAQVRVVSSAVSLTFETADGVQPVVRAADGTFVGGLTVEADGYLAVTPLGPNGEIGSRRLIGVTAIQDHAPEVRITEPAKDLYLRSGDTRIPVGLRAADDLGLRSVTLAYTKVAGAGESFAFTEGTVPVTVTQVSEREWTAVGVLPLDTMALDVGDMVVYRGVALDQRPGAAPVESDAFIVEIVSAANAMSEGFSIDDRQDKYALSQQMVIIKTERLLAKAPGLSQDELLDEALGIAAEQRSVRAEIVFMTGGEFEDEVVESEHEGELSAGRLDNTGRADLGLATRAMSRAATELVAGELKTALVSEREALTAMQRALSRRRFILRTLTLRARVDDSRRLQGRLVDLGRGVRPVDAATVSALVDAARTALLVTTQVSRQTTLTFEHSAELSRAASGLLSADGRGAPVVDVASRLSAAAEAIAAGTPDVARRALADAGARLTAIASAELATAPMTAVDDAAARLRGALADALRAGGGR